MREIYIYVFIFNFALLLFELAAIRRVLKEMVQELKGVRSMMSERLERK
jgi:hypothetical protein